MTRSYNIVAPTRPDVFIRLHRDAWLLRRRRVGRQLWRRLAYIISIIIPGLVTADILGYRLARGGDISGLPFLLELIPVMVVTYAIIWAVEWLERRRRRERWLRAKASGDLSNHDFQLHFDEELLRLTTHDYTLEFRWANVRGYTLMPRTVFINTPVGQELMFAEEYLGAEAFAALTAIVREKVSMRK